ncbi:hypothetical protein SOVF_001030 [Spinacia oleracea]|uniref:Uncharacterized protein n=1 Tax=Spinacia oleracea TaxID=3562 RepID=A0ABM3QMH3_SPIOL|nr:uncharacterized protein LOC110775859 [Spinacia oleracea]KNA26034.1 hypothetical protein SOVF_001030 [Spinacia oleracea]
MGNQVSNYGSPATGKVILLDGSIQEFDNPLTVAELMLEYPQQMVVDLKSSTTQKRTTPLPADKTLEVNKVYLMVPLRRGKLAHLSPQEANQILIRVNAMLIRSKTMNSSLKFLPLIAKICPTASAGGENNYCKSAAYKKDVLGFEGGGELDDDDLVEKPDYLSRQVSGKSWKPSLDTIEEKKNEVKKGSNWVIVANKVGKRIHNKGLVWG